MVRKNHRPTIPLEEAFNNLVLLNIIVKENQNDDYKMQDIIILDLEKLKANNMRLVYLNRNIYVISSTELTSTNFIPFEANVRYLKLPIASISQIYNQTQGLSR